MDKAILRWTFLKTEIWVRKAHPTRDCWHIKENENPQPLATRCWLGFADAHPRHSREIYDANLGLSISILLGCFVSSCPLSLNIHCKVPLGISVFWHRHTKPISTCLEVRACYYVILHSFCVQLRFWRSSQGSQLNLISLGKVPVSRSIVPIDSWQRSYICLASSGLSCGQLGKRHL